MTPGVSVGAGVNMGASVGMEVGTSVGANVGSFVGLGLGLGLGAGWVGTGVACSSSAAAESLSDRTAKAFTSTGVTVGLRTSTDAQCFSCSSAGARNSFTNDASAGWD